MARWRMLRTAPRAAAAGSGDGDGRLRHRRFERDPKHIPDVVGQVEGHLLPDLLRYVVQVALVPVWQHDLRQPRTVRREHLLLHAADREDTALQGHLTGHAA